MIPEQKPCANPTHRVVGYYPEMTAGGILYLAQSLDEASQAADCFREEGFKKVRVFKEGPRAEEASQDIVWKLITEG